ncbi:putative DNA binding domain-containing protein, partial [bacterium]|nr:putative DNA binding domain-containing protein [bacterium]
MTKDQLHKLIAQGEGQRLEFKESVAELDRVIQTLAAFANTNPDGGYVLIGVGDKGKVKEVLIGKETIKQIADKISAHTDPVLYPEIEVVKESQDKGIIVITIDGSPNKPHLAFGRAYKRVGSTTTQMTRDEYERMLLAKHKDKFQFDSQVCEGATLEDIDEEKMRWFLKTAKIERGLAIEENTSIPEVLMRLKLIQNGKLLSAAILFFGKAPQDFFLQSEAKCIHFKGTKVTGPMIDMNTIGGNLINQVKEIERFIFNNIKMAAWIESGK